MGKVSHPGPLLLGSGALGGTRHGAGAGQAVRGGGAARPSSGRVPEGAAVAGSPRAGPAASPDRVLPRLGLRLCAPPAGPLDRLRAGHQQGDFASCEVPATCPWQTLYELEARVLRLLMDHLSGSPFSVDRTGFPRDDLQPRDRPGGFSRPGPAITALSRGPCLSGAGPLPQAAPLLAPSSLSPGVLLPQTLAHRGSPLRSRLCPAAPRLLDALRPHCLPSSAWGHRALASALQGLTQAQRGHRPGRGGPRGELGLGGPAGPLWRPWNLIRSIAGGLMQFRLKSQYKHESFSFLFFPY